MSTQDCPFCDPKQSYRYILETAQIIAMYPKAPACRYQVLLIPKRHIAGFDELNQAELEDIQDSLKSLVTAAKANMPDFIGYNLLSNNGGPLVNQQVMHGHMHVFLRGSADIGDPLANRHSGVPPNLTDDNMKHLEELRGWVI